MWLLIGVSKQTYTYTYTSGQLSFIPLCWLTGSLTLLCVGVTSCWTSCLPAVLFSLLFQCLLFQIFVLSIAVSKSNISTSGSTKTHPGETRGWTIVKVVSSDIFKIPPASTSLTLTLTVIKSIDFKVVINTQHFDGIYCSVDVVK